MRYLFQSGKAKVIGSLFSFLSVFFFSLILCSSDFPAKEDKNEFLKKPTEASCAVDISDAGPLQTVTADWKPQRPLAVLPFRQMMPV